MTAAQSFVACPVARPGGPAGPRQQFVPPAPARPETHAHQPHHGFSPPTPVHQATPHRYNDPVTSVWPARATIRNSMPPAVCARQCAAPLRATDHPVPGDCRQRIERRQPPRQPPGRHAAPGQRCVEEGHRHGQPPGGPGCAKPAGSGPRRAGRQTCCGPAQGAVSLRCGTQTRPRQICWQ